MSPDWKIRKATLADSEGLKNCMESAYAMYQKRMGGNRLPPMDVDYSAEIQHFPTWVVDANGRIFGGLIMMFKKNDATIANVAVDPEHQGKGIGSALINFAQSKAKEQGYSELHLATHVLLKENIALYQYLGWEVTERDETKVRMKKEI